jgi:hypothetical protein
MACQEFDVILLSISHVERNRRKRNREINVHGITTFILRDLQENNNKIHVQCFSLQHKRTQVRLFAINTVSPFAKFATIRSTDHVALCAELILKRSWTYFCVIDFYDLLPHINKTKNNSCSYRY